MSDAASNGAESANAASVPTRRPRFAEISRLRAQWARARWVVLLVGTAFAGVIAHAVVSATLTGE